MRGGRLRDKETRLGKACRTYRPGLRFGGDEKAKKKTKTTTKVGGAFGRSGKARGFCGLGTHSTYLLLFRSNSCLTCLCGWLYYYSGLAGSLYEKGQHQRERSTVDLAGDREDPRGFLLLATVSEPSGIGANTHMDLT